MINPKTNSIAWCIMKNERMNAIENLALLKKEVRICIDAISEFDWDYDGIPFVLKGDEVARILVRFLDDNISPSELELWADALELREDIKFEEGERDWIQEVVAILSSSELNGPITKSSVTDLLRRRQ